MDTELCEFLPWDSGFFGHRIGRVIPQRLTTANLATVLEWKQAQQIECLYFLADGNDRETLFLAERHGFHMVDIRVTLSYTGVQDATVSDLAFIRPARPDDLLDISAIARYSYRDTRFYFDAHFPRQRCDDFYELWVQKSLTGYADAVQVAETPEGLSGYITCHRGPAPHEGRIGLVGVSERARGQGIGRQLVLAAQEWARQQTITKFTVVTQGRNIAAQRLYQRCNFITQSVQIWYHRWSTDADKETQ